MPSALERRLSSDVIVSCSAQETLLRVLFGHFSYTAVAQAVSRVTAGAAAAAEARGGAVVAVAAMAMAMAMAMTMAMTMTVVTEDSGDGRDAALTWPNRVPNRPRSRPTVGRTRPSSADTLQPPSGTLRPPPPPVSLKAELRWLQ